MRIAVTGSIATDHLMVFEGRFADSLVVEQLDRVALSFLVEDLRSAAAGSRRTSPSGWRRSASDPLLVGAVGRGLRRVPVLAGAARRRLLRRPRLRPAAHRPVRLHHRPRPGADRLLLRGGDARGARDRARAADGRAGRSTSWWSSPNDPEAMLRHTEECRTRGIPFAADPSQQLAWSDGPLIQRARRRRGVPVQQRLRGRPDHPARPAGATTRCSRGSASGS